MFKLIKMDMRRLFHSKVFYLVLILSAVISLLTMFAILGFAKLYLAMPNIEEYEMSPEDFAVVREVFHLDWVDEGAEIGELIYIGLDSSLFFSCILTAIFVTAEYASGYIKNIAGQIPNRGLLAISKLCPMAVYNFCIITVFCLAASFAGLIFVPHISGGNIPLLIEVLLTKFLLYIAVDTIILFVCSISKSKAFSIGVSVISGLGVTGSLYGMVDLFLNTVFGGIDISISKLIPDGINEQISLASNTSTIIQALIVAVVYIVIFSYLSYMAMKKLDIR